MPDPRHQVRKKWSRQPGARRHYYHTAEVHRSPAQEEFFRGQQTRSIRTQQELDAGEYSVVFFYILFQPQVQQHPPYATRPAAVRMP